jgi:hypothetical protein
MGVKADCLENVGASASQPHGPSCPVTRTAYCDSCSVCGFVAVRLCLQHVHAKGSASHFHPFIIHRGCNVGWMNRKNLE